MVKADYIEVIDKHFSAKQQRLSNIKSYTLERLKKVIEKYNIEYDENEIIRAKKENKIEKKKDNKKITYTTKHYDVNFDLISRLGLLDEVKYKYVKKLDEDEIYDIEVTYKYDPNDSPTEITAKFIFETDSIKVSMNNRWNTSSPFALIMCEVVECELEDEEEDEEEED
jgi:hypothetical protein